MGFYCVYERREIQHPMECGNDATCGCPGFPKAAPPAQVRITAAMLNAAFDVLNPAAKRVVWNDDLYVALKAALAVAEVTPAPAVTPTEDALHAENDRLRGLLSRCQTVLGNMARENEGAIFRRWPIHHEPLRADAKNLVPLIDKALNGEPA